MSHVMGFEESVQATIDMEGSIREMRTFHQTIQMIPDDLQSTCVVRFCGRAKINVELICCAILAFYCYDMHEEKYLDGI